MYEHLNLNEIDDSRKAVEEGVYTLEVNSITPKWIEVKKAGSQFEGQTVLVLKGSYTIVDDPTYSGRKLWNDFFTPTKIQQVFLKKQMQATGVIQEAGQSLIDYVAQFATLNPPARFQVQVKKIADYRDPTGPAVNEIGFFTAKPC